MKYRPDDLSVCVLLGKALHHGKITEELRGRIAHLVQLLDTTCFDMIAFCGGGQPSEARAAYAEFQIQQSADTLAASAEKSPHHFEVFLDESSTNTIENVDAVVEYVRKCHGERSLGITLLSTDYHIQRLETVDALAPQTSLLRSLKMLPGGPLKMCGGPYCYDFRASPRVRWLAAVYRNNDMLNVPRVSIEGIINRDGQLIGDLSHLSKDVLKCFMDTIAVLKNLSLQAPSACEQENSDLGEYLVLLDSCHQRLNSILAYPAPSRENIKRLQGCLNTLDSIITKVRAITDQDYF